MTPNYAAMFERYVTQIEHLARLLAEGLREPWDARAGLGHISDATYEVVRKDAELSLFNSVLFSINMAAQCMTSEAEVVRFRAATFGALTAVHKELDAFRAEHDDDEDEE